MKTPEHLPQDWKLLITGGNPRIVHARGCEHIRDWREEGSEPLPKLRPQKHNICKVCEGLAYVTVGAKDYVENLAKYKQVCAGVSPAVLKELFVENRAKSTIIGSRLYLTVKDDRWFIDFSLGDVRLFHNNYRIIRRERKKGDFSDPGYHEHSIRGRSDRMQKAFENILGYDYEEAEKAHKKKRKKRPRVILSEYDPEAYGFKDR